MNPKVIRSNFRHLYVDVLGYGILAGSTMAFLAIYAARLGATGFQVSLLTAGPAVVNLLFSLPFGSWMEGKGLIRIQYWSAVWHRIGYLALIPLPWLFTPYQETWMIVLITVVMSLPGVMLAIGFNAMFADVVPPEWRGEVVGKRNAILAFSLTLTSLLCGQLLDRIPFPLNYQIVFAIGVWGAALSTYHLGKLKPLERLARRVQQPLRDLARPGLLRFVDSFRFPTGLRFLTRSGGKPLLRLDLLKSSFGLFMLAYYLFYTFQYTSIPILPLFLVRDLRLSDGEISLGNALFYALMLLVSLGLRGISARLGHRRVLVLGALFYGIYPLLNGLAHQADLYWVASILGGGMWALSNAGLTNRLMERVPKDDRPAHMALHNLALNLGILSGSLLGPLAADSLGLRGTMLLTAGLRFLGGVLLLIWG